MHLAKYIEWLSSVTDEQLLNELNQIKDNPTEIENRFYKDLEFGTGGLRGILGAGSSYMNIYTVGRATQGIADYMRANGFESVAISFDSRNMSKEFAMYCATIFAYNNITTHITKELSPTPFLSYCVRKLRTDMGIMITASHNPAKYNGYKVYNSQGCQLNNDCSYEVMDYISKVDYFSVKTADAQQALRTGLIKYVFPEVYDSYMACVSKQSRYTPQQNFDVVYTALNGAGYKLCPQILQSTGANVIKVQEQCVPDGNFPTCPYPNPEVKEAIALGIEKLVETQADLLIATDPDADRIGLTVLENGQPRLLSGNETGVLLLDYVASRRIAMDDYPKYPLFVKTIVTTKLARKVAESYGCKVIDVLTGFKYIGEQIFLLERDHSEYEYVFGFEESYGYLAGTYVRDKDAVVASMLAAEMCAYWKEQGKSILSRLQEIYDEFGLYCHKLLNYEFLGASGNATMQRKMDEIRKSNLQQICGLKVTKLTDYLTQREIDLPKENVLVFDLQNDAQVVMRPSGTEPKLKVYLTAVGQKSEAEALLAQLIEFADSLFKN